MGGPLVLALACVPTAQPAPVAASPSEGRAVGETDAISPESAAQEQHASAEGGWPYAAVAVDSPAPTVVDAAPLSSGAGDASTPIEQARNMDRSAAGCDGRMDSPLCMATFPQKIACPASFSDVPIGSYCGIEGRTAAPEECRYPEGRCQCARIPYCGGAAPSFLQQTGMVWSCRALRMASDCPDIAAPGARCSVDGQQCAYPGCGVATSCTCTQARYRCQTQHRAPPPSAAPTNQ
jgi:hypothetical protein